MIRNTLTFLQPTAVYRELILLEEIGLNTRITQQRLAQKAGVVPAMVNNYIKNFVRDGYVIVKGNKTRNVSYALTPDGERRKFNLLVLYLKETVLLYKSAKEGLKARLYAIRNEGIEKIILFGAADTAELAFKAAEEVGLTVLAVVDSDMKKQGKEFLGKIIQCPTTIQTTEPDAVIISSFGYQEEIYNEIKILEQEGIKVRKL